MSDLDDKLKYFPQVKYLDHVKMRADYLYSYLKIRGFTERDLFPGFDGEIMVTAYDGDLYYEFVVDPDYTVAYTHEATNKMQYIDSISMEECVDIIDALANKPENAI
jgi:hypothetical protein